MLWIRCRQQPSIRRNHIRKRWPLFIPQMPRSRGAKGGSSLPPPTFAILFGCASLPSPLAPRLENIRVPPPSLLPQLHGSSPAEAGVDQAGVIGVFREGGLSISLAQ